MRLLSACILAGSIGLSGCGDNGGDDGSTPTGPVSDVTGTLMDTHVTTMGDVSNMRAPIEFEVAAVYTGADGARNEILAIVGKDGNFRIPKVPEVPIDIRFIETYGSGTLAPRYIMNAPRNIDLGRVYVGRPDAEAINVTPTELELTASGLDAWADGDELEMFSLDSGAAGALIPTDGMMPAAGSTSLSNYAVDTSALISAKLTNGDVGDKAIITQLKGTGGSAPYLSVRTVAELPSFTQTDGASTAVSGQFTDVAQKSLSVDIAMTNFLALAPTVHPTAEIGGKNISIIAEPGANRATTSFTPNLLICEATPNAGLPSSFSYGNPFPSTWAEVVTVDVSFVVTHAAPTGISKPTAVSIGHSRPVDSFVSSVEPLMSPPINITINGTPAQDTVTGVGYSPTIAFSPPATGNAAAYIVAVRRLDPGGGTTRTTALFSTKETSIQIPDGLLDFGYYYYVRVTARGEFNIDQPFKNGTTSTYASAVTGVFTP